MTEYTLTLTDVRQVQRYIFGANELKQHVGASELVERATHEWAKVALPESNNALDPRLETLDEGKTIESGKLRAEVIFAGGGNVAVLFASHDEAVQFAQRYTRAVLEAAPGLEVAVGHTPVEWNSPGSLAAAWEKMHREVMPRRKEGVTPPQAVAGLSVTAQCAYTGQPAIEEHKEPGSERGVLISAEVRAKLDHFGPGHERLKHILPIQHFEYPLNFDQLGGQPGRANYIAVVHADGNGMGKRLSRYASAPGNREMVNRLRRFSQSVNRQGKKAMKAVRDLLTQKVTMEDRKWQVTDELGKDDAVRLNGNYLPLRPIVFGGDDVTFVCDGRLGPALAAKFLETFDDAPLDDGAPGYACAGVAIVHTHFPFAQAYALAEALCRDAKKEVRKLTEGQGEKASASLVHWHFAVSGVLADWEEIRRREYSREKDGDLIIRPLTVAASAGVGFDRWRGWDAFLRMAADFRGEGWARRRNKMKALRSALRAGPDATKEFTSLHGELPPVAELGTNAEAAQREGWYGGRCVYFDAVEADDLFIYPEV